MDTFCRHWKCNAFPCSDRQNVVNSRNVSDIGAKIAWKIATEYVENEFKNDFEEYDFYYVIIENAGWFYDVAWDYSFIIVDKKNYEILFMDITDTD